MKPQFAPASLLRFPWRSADVLYRLEPVVRICQLVLLVWLSVEGAGMLAHVMTNAMIS